MTQIADNSFYNEQKIIIASRRSGHLCVIPATLPIMTALVICYILLSRSLSCEWKTFSLKWVEETYRLLLLFRSGMGYSSSMRTIVYSYALRDAAHASAMTTYQSCKVARRLSSHSQQIYRVAGIEFATNWFSAIQYSIEHYSQSLYQLSYTRLNGNGHASKYQIRIYHSHSNLSFIHKHNCIISSYPTLSMTQIADNSFYSSQ